MAMPRGTLIERIMWSGHLRGAWIVLTVAMLGSAALVGIGAMKHVDVPADDHPALEVVESYLSAVRGRDVDAALALTDPTVEHNEDFLTSEAIDSNWQIEELEAFSTSRWTAVVNTAIASPDGRKASGTFQVQEFTGAWLISDPFATITVSRSPIPIVAVNGLEATMQDQSRESFSVFPGLYRFQNIQSKVLDGPSYQRLVLNDSLQFGADSGADIFTLTVTGEEQLQSQVNKLIDQCVDMSDLLMVGCPFGAERVPVPSMPGYVFKSLDQIEWTVKEYPVVTGGQDDGDFVVADRHPGIVELVGVGTHDDGTRENVKMECPIIDSLLRFVLDGGDLRLLDFRPGGADADGDRYIAESFSWSTCRS